MTEPRYIPNFPVNGINFIDISPVLADKSTFNNIIEEMCSKIPKNIDYIISPESRGYIFGPTIANKLGKGFVPIRKPGKLPDNLVISVEYQKEYGPDILCLPKNDNYINKNFYFIDDILATGGTLKASKKLIEKVDGNYIGGLVYINISFLNNENIEYIKEEKEN